jgi:AraC family transcriptional regulator
VAYGDVRTTQVEPPRNPGGRDFSGEARRLVTSLETGRSGELLHQAISLLDAAVRQLPDPEHPAHGTILQATTLLRTQIGSGCMQGPLDGRGRLLAWQARKVRDYIDRHLTGPVSVAELCALVQLSEAHFSRAFKCTFGESPHAFVIRCRLELAARYMLGSNAPLSDIAVRCGFVDQSHFSNHFRRATGLTPAAWRRARRTLEDADGGSIASRERVPVMSLRSVCRSENANGHRAAGLRGWDAAGNR